LPLPQEGDRWEAELRALREDLKALREEQQEMAAAINQLVTTFRTLATHLGIAAEPYTRREANTAARDLPGFG
jgi:prefoldin subunit 5